MIYDISSRVSVDLGIDVPPRDRVVIDINWGHPFRSWNLLRSACDLFRFAKFHGSDDPQCRSTRLCSLVRFGMSRNCSSGHLPSLCEMEYVVLEYELSYPPGITTPKNIIFSGLFLVLNQRSTSHKESIDLEVRPWFIIPKYSQTRDKKDIQWVKKTCFINEDELRSRLCNGDVVKTTDRWYVW